MEHILKGKLAASISQHQTNDNQTREADGIINRAIDAIIAHNNAPGRLHDDKWAITINGLKNFSLNQRTIERITQERKDEIEQHHDYALTWSKA